VYSSERGMQSAIRYDMKCELINFDSNLDVTSYLNTALLSQENLLSPWDPSQMSLILIIHEICVVHFNIYLVIFNQCM
jgi:hypothetical protein